MSSTVNQLAVSPDEMRKARAQIPCPVELTISLLSTKWKVLILRDLLDGTRRFSELMRSLPGVSQKVLTANLRTMEEDGLLTRKIYPQVPPKVEYSLTDLGQSLRPVIEVLMQWGLHYKELAAAGKI